MGKVETEQDIEQIGNLMLFEGACAQKFERGAFGGIVYEHWGRSEIEGFLVAYWIRKRFGIVPVLTGYFCDSCINQNDLMILLKMGQKYFNRL